MSNVSPTEAELLNEMKRSWESDFRFFSGSGQVERECWVVQEFLSLLSVAFSHDEIKPQEQKSKVDVKFRDALFQIKEIPDPNILRTREIKEIYKRVMNAKTLQEIVGPDFIYDVPQPITGYKLVLDKARELAQDERYIKVTANLDLLIYITRTRTSYVQQSEINHNELSAIGWRSISCLIGNQALVLIGHENAPTFLHH